MNKAPEQYRTPNPNMQTNKSHGNNGYFVIPHYRNSAISTHIGKAYFFDCIISDDSLLRPDELRHLGSTRWEHVSVRVWYREKGKRINCERCPTWEEMCYIKDIFWSKDEFAVQYHPPHSEYVNNNDWTLHLFRPIGIEYPRPESIRIGYTKEQVAQQ